MTTLSPVTRRYGPPGSVEAEAADVRAGGEARRAVVERVRLAVVAGDEVGAAVAVQVADRERLRVRRVAGERGRRSGEAVPVRNDHAIPVPVAVALRSSVSVARRRGAAAAAVNAVTT